MLTIYKKSNIFRLPYQSNKEKQYVHSIIQGKPIDFVINYINNSKNYYNSETYKYNIENTHIIDTNNEIEIEKININIIEQVNTNISILDIDKNEIQLFNMHYYDVIHRTFKFYFK